MCTNTSDRQDSEAEAEEDPTSSFDFEAHRDSAVEDYRRVRGTYEDFAAALKRILIDSLKTKGLTFHSVDARAKDIDSFGEKSETPSDDDHSRPRYESPLDEITDLAGVRIITYFPRTVGAVAEIIHTEFAVLEHADHSHALKEEGRFGYLSVHFLVKMKEDRIELPEYSRYANLIAEIQVRTILQHAWAEIEHDIQYKSPTTTPLPLRRRFMALAGLLEIADREFQAIQDEDAALTDKARSSVEGGQYEHVEITANLLKSYLDRNLGQDRRIAAYSYEWIARTLRRLGFASLDQVDECIEGYDDDKLSRIQWGGRQGQIWRFESMLLAGMGETFIERRSTSPSSRATLHRQLNRFRERGVRIGNYDPQSGSESI